MLPTFQRHAMPMLISRAPPDAAIALPPPHDRYLIWLPPLLMPRAMLPCLIPLRAMLQSPPLPYDATLPFPAHAPLSLIEAPRHYSYCHIFHDLIISPLRADALLLRHTGASSAFIYSMIALRFRHIMSAIIFCRSPPLF